MSWITSEFELYVQTVKCGDYFQAEDGPRDFGNISIVTKWIKTTDTSLLLRNLKVGYKEVSFIYLHLYFQMIRRNVNDDEMKKKCGQWWNALLFLKRNGFYVFFYVLK